MSRRNIKNNNQSTSSVSRQTARQANRRGVYAVRRKVSHESCETIFNIAEVLGPELDNAARLFYAHDLGVTVIGFGRQDKRHKGKGPKTSDVSELVSSSKNSLVAHFGKLSIFGHGKKKKLGLNLSCEELRDEENKYCDEFLKKGFPLRPDYNNDGIYAPHLSIALLNNDYVDHFSDPRVLRRLNRLANLGGSLLQEITLEPVNAQLNLRTN